MKVLEFAKRLGIPASKIRFYDRQGITQSRRGSENNYRQFTEQDALVIYNAQMLRSFDMSVKEASTAAHTYALGRFSGWLEERIAALEQELRLEQMRMARLEQLRGDLRAMSEQGAGVLRTAHQGQLQRLDDRPRRFLHRRNAVGHGAPAGKNAFFLRNADGAARKPAGRRGGAAGAPGAGHFKREHGKVRF